MLLTIICQISTAIIALVALRKDWASYCTISKRFGRWVPITLVFIIGLSTVFAISLTAKNSGRIEELMDQLKQNDQKADARSIKQTEIFGTYLDNVYTRLTDLQTKANNDPLLRQNRVLLQEIQDTRVQVIEAKERLEQSAKQAILVASFSDNSKHIDKSAISVPLLQDYTLDLTIYVHNISDIQTKKGTIFIQICPVCSFAKEPERFVKAIGAPDTERILHFEAMPAGTMMSIPLKIKVPGLVAPTNKYTINVMSRCDNCTVKPWEKLIVNIQ
jgi:hypothetical protein